MANPRATLNRIIRKCEKQIVDAEAYAEMRPDDEPIDVEVERVLRRLALDALDKYDYGEEHEAAAAMKRLSDYAAAQKAIARHRDRHK